MQDFLPSTVTRLWEFACKGRTGSLAAGAETIPRCGSANLKLNFKGLGPVEGFIMYFGYVLGSELGIYTRGPWFGL